MEPVDLSGYRLVSLEEVAQMWRISPAALKQRYHAGTFPVLPKEKNPLRWSSVELREWFEDARKRRI